MHLVAVVRGVTIAALLAGCSNSQPSPASGSSAPGSAAPTAQPSAGPGSNGGSGASIAPSVTPPTQAPPATTKPAAGSWTVTLTGPKPGAGTYGGTGAIYCSATSDTGKQLWTASGILLSSDITQLSLQENVSGFDTISIGTPGGIETGLWFVESTTGNGSAEVIGSGDQDRAQVTGDGEWTDSAGKHFTIHVSVACSDISL